VKHRVPGVEMRTTNHDLVRPNLSVALKRLLGVFPNFYQSDFYHVLWVTHDITSGDFCIVLGNAVVRRLKVPL
jgi:hypothetical protein